MVDAVAPYPTTFEVIMTLPLVVGSEVRRDRSSQPFTGSANSRGRDQHYCCSPLPDYSKASKPVMARLVKSLGLVTTGNTVNHLRGEFGSPEIQYPFGGLQWKSISIWHDYQLLLVTMA